ncbi:hypothetical protein IHN57_20410, partial [Deinococcus sp. 6GRE01]|nr:hypothetical protein [Deinococcus sp. 6GRE01]
MIDRPLHLHADRPVPAQFTAEQAAVVSAVRDSGRHLLIRATAGSGKT